MSSPPPVSVRSFDEYSAEELNEMSLADVLNIPAITFEQYANMITARINELDIHINTFESMMAEKFDSRMDAKIRKFWEERKEKFIQLSLALIKVFAVIIGWEGLSRLLDIFN